MSVYLLTYLLTVTTRPPADIFLIIGWPTNINGWLILANLYLNRRLVCHSHTGHEVYNE